MLRYTILLLALFGVASVLLRTAAGQTPSPAYQCRILGYPGVCKVSDPAERCKLMFCAKPRQTGNAIPVNIGPADEYTECDTNKVCRFKKCIDYKIPPESMIVKRPGDEFDCSLF